MAFYSCSSLMNINYNELELTVQTVLEIFIAKQLRHNNIVLYILANQLVHIRATGQTKL